MRPVVQLHTIQQWFGVDEGTRKLILQHLKVRDRLWAWVMAREQQRSMDNNAHEEGWYPCRECKATGWKPKRPRRLGVHPSSLARPCQLQIYFETVGAQQQVRHEATLQILFDLGTAIHDMLQEYGESGAWGTQYRKEVDIGTYDLAKQYRIQGHADAENILVVSEIPGHPIYEVGLVHEYKSINNNGFAGLKGRPMPKHKMQATIYSACLDRPVVVYLYMNKDNSNIVDFPVPFDNRIWQEMASRAAVINQHLDDKTIPQASVGFHCQQCGYMYGCEAYQAAKAARQV